MVALRIKNSNLQNERSIQMKKIGRQELHIMQDTIRYDQRCGGGIRGMVEGYSRDYTVKRSLTHFGVYPLLSEWLT